jgi:predicted TIM-barrel fold metal-dependent hydrolase
MLRREFIKRSAAFSAATLLPFPAIADTSSRKIIDCHCHLFNARDVPIEGFVDRVIVPSLPDDSQLTAPGGEKLLRFFVRFMKEWAFTYAAGAEDEATEIGKLIRGETTPRKVDVADMIALRHLIEQLVNLTKKGTSFPVPGAGLVAPYVPGYVIGNLLLETYPEAVDNPYDQNNWPPTKLIAQHAYGKINGPISRYLNWGLIFTRYRYEIAEGLETLHGQRARLATPALIDFSNWLNDSQDVALSQQVDAMAWVSRWQAKKGRNLHIHGFAPFDPLREAINRYTSHRDPEMPLALAQRAVREQGFIGVKLYPPMGFMPLGNKGVLSAPAFPHHLDPAFRKELPERLDAILRELYKWCEDEQVPILAHARDSNGPDPSASALASPDNWSIVLKTFPGLRLSLAHFGDFKEAVGTKKKNAKVSDTWDYKMARLVQQHPNSLVYLDVSYFDRALPPKKDRTRPPDNDPTQPPENDEVYKKVCQMFGEVIAAHSKPVPLADRMLFGTDWTMLGQEELFAPVAQKGQYADLIFRVLSEGFKLGDASATRVMYDNAITFLGLGATNPGKNRERLKTFYSRSGLDAGWLDEL